MQATHLTISKETMERSDLTLKRKQQLRREAICKLIDSKPVGTTISLDEFKAVAHFKTLGNTHAFISKMVAKGDMVRHDGHKPRTFSYSVTHATVVTKTKGMDVATIEERAKAWAWENNSDSLRGFIISLKGGK